MARQARVSLFGYTELYGAVPGGQLGALRTADKAVRHGGTVSLSGVYGGEVDPMPMREMFRTTCHWTRRRTATTSFRRSSTRASRWF